MSNSDKPWSEEVVRDLQDSLDLGDTFAETASFLCRESTRCGRKRGRSAWWHIGQASSSAALKNE